MQRSVNVLGTRTTGKDTGQSSLRVLAGELPAVVREVPALCRGEGGSTGPGQARQKEEREKGRVVHSVPVKTYRQVLTRIVIY